MTIRGAIPALITPYDSTGQVSEEMLRRLVEVHIRAGAAGLYLCGGSGEGLLLSTAERKNVAAAVTQQVHGRIPVIVHVGSIRTDEATELAGHAERIGADAIASIPPFFYGMSTEAIYGHYLQIAQNSNLPLFLYNIPSAVHITVTPKMMARFMESSSVVGIKFSSYNLFEMWQMLQLDHGRLNVLAGNDEVFLAALAMGAHGSIGLTHNFMPRLYVDIYDNYCAGRWDTARECQNYANRVISVLLEYPMIPAAKEIMRLKGYDCGNCRGPLEKLTDQETDGLRRALMALSFLEKELGL